MSDLHIKTSRMLLHGTRAVATAAILTGLMGGAAGWTAASAAEKTDRAGRISAGEASREEVTVAGPQSPAAPKGQFHIGDRLQINFLEYLELPQAASTDTDDAAATMRTFYQRLDLTGEYRVDVDATITVPLLGRFEVGGKSLDDLRNEIAIVFERETNRSGEVHVAVLERQPVFVMGVVRNPGSYSFSPGMIALQAIALAGGLERAPEAGAQRLDAKRERERLAQAMQRLTRLTARRARLIEERDGKPVAATHPMLALAATDADDLLAGERNLLEAQAAMRTGTAELQATVLTGARGELEALHNSVALVNRQIEERTERLRVLQQMQGRGVTNLEVVWAARKDVADFELQREQLLTAIHLAEQKVAQADSARSMVELDHRTQVARELLTIEDEIAQLETTIATAREVAGTLEAIAAARGAGPHDVMAIEILRRTGDGVTALAADESTDLMPGDVVKVTAVQTDMIHTAQTARP